MAHLNTSTSAGGSSAWSFINVLLAGVFGLITLFLGTSLVYSGILASREKHGPKLEVPKADVAMVAAPASSAPASVGAAPAPVSAATAGPTQDLELSPDAVNPMAYAIKLFTVKAGQPVKLTFSNKAAVPLPHNVVVGKAGTKDVLFGVAAKLMMDPTGMAKGYIPENCPEMLAHTALVQPGQTETISFTCATPGDYPYMCMFPGHSMLMNGVIKAE
ncbi:MAG: rane-bound dehydrogenase domain protein [Verrucomicrobiaceae bacterium]|nr:rane-bound dehydrogenase domain protein [Verrucomicrobiaceae bacterium]